MFCPHCGREISENGQFCPFCGLSRFEHSVSPNQQNSQSYQGGQARNNQPSQQNSGQTNAASLQPQGKGKLTKEEKKKFNKWMVWAVIAFIVVCIFFFFAVMALGSLFAD